MESTGLSISVIVKMVEVGKEERGTKSKLTLLLPSHHSSARKIVSGKVAAPLMVELLKKKSKQSIVTEKI